jgi:Ca2+-binding RTX toxin-like protein
MSGGDNDVAYIYTANFATTAERDAYAAQLRNLGIEQVRLGEENRAPTDILLSPNSIREHSRNGVEVGQLSAVDADVGDTFTYRLLDNAGGRFALSVVDGVAKIVTADGMKLDFEQQRSHDITIEVNDGHGGVLERMLTIDVRNMVIEIISQSTGSHRLVGGGSADQINGGGGNDTLVGGQGKDRLTGGTGEDVFIFDQRPNESNRDTVTDFSVLEDKIHLTQLAFNKAGPLGQLTAAAFHAGAQAHDGDDRIIYDASTGKLFYDADGTGITAAVEIATFTTKPDLTAGHFLII